MRFQHLLMVDLMMNYSIPPSELLPHSSSALFLQFLDLDLETNQTLIKFLILLLICRFR